MESFAARLNAAEGSFFRLEQRQATVRHIEKLVDQGKLPEATLSGLEASTFAHAGFQDIPVTVINSKPASEVVFRYNGQPVPKMSATESWARLGTTKVSLGRARWNTDGASIFSVQDGKRLAQTPVKEPTAWELNRMRKISKAAVDTRVVQGIRLMPEYTPARALLWGSILALWGTGAIVATVARRLEIHESQEASEKLREVLTPYIGFSKRMLEPLKAWFHTQETTDLQTSLVPVNELARRMRGKLGHEQHA
jgi:hypothetical protein